MIKKLTGFSERRDDTVDLIFHLWIDPISVLFGVSFTLISIMARGISVALDASTHAQSGV